MTEKTKVMSIRVPKSVLRKLERTAKQSGRTVFKEAIHRAMLSLDREDEDAKA